MPDNKTRISQAYLSDFLASEDVRILVQDKKNIVTIDYMKQHKNHKVQGKKIPVCIVALPNLRSNHFLLFCSTSIHILKALITV